MGLPHAIAVTTADVTDRNGAIQMILLNLDNLSCVKKFLVDGGYSGERFANQVKDICGAQVEVVKRSELHKFVVLPRRWVVERLFGWLDKFRRLWKNCERKLLISAHNSYFCSHRHPYQKILNANQELNKRATRAAAIRAKT